MSEQRLIDANALMDALKGKYLESDPKDPEQLGYLTARIITRNQPTIEAVPREEYESLLKRFRHLLESDYIRSFDEVKLGTGEYKRDIREADLENQRAHWIANCTCSRCLRGVRGYAIQSGYVFCPFCGADMREVHE